MTGPPETTYSIWGLVGVFVAITLIGLAVLLFFRPAEDSSVQVPTSQTLPEGYEDPATSAPAASEGDTAEAGDAGSGPPTWPDGAPAPDGVNAIEVGDGTTTLLFDPPAGATDDEGDLVAGTRSVIAPAAVTVAEGGEELVVRVACAESAEEFLAQLSVTEADTVVTVAAVAVVPDGGPPCGAGEVEERVLTVPLTAPVGDRSVVSVPGGTPVDPGQG